MAGISKLKLAVETGEWDAGLKKAMQAMNNFTRDAGSIEQALRKDSDAMSKFAQMMGNMDTASKAPRQALREVTNTILELQATYKSLSDADKSSDFGKNLQATIDKLKQKAGGLKDQMADLEEEIKHLASDTSLSDSMNMMTRTVGSCASAIVAWTDGGKEMDAVIKNLAKIQTTVAAVEALTKAFQAQNLVLLANPYVLMASSAAALTFALVELTNTTSDVNKAIDDMKGKISESVAEFDTLTTIVHDNTIAIDERKRALEELIRIVPNYHASLTEEGKLINENTDALIKYRQELVKNAVYNALKEKIEEETKALVEQQIEVDKLTKEYEKHQKEGDSTAGLQKMLKNRIEEATAKIVDQKNKIDNIITTYTSAANALSMYNEQLSLLSSASHGAQGNKGAGIGAGLLGVVNGAKGKGGSGKRGGGGRRGGGSTKKDTYVPVEGSIDAMQDKVKELNKQFNATADQGVRDNLKSQIEECNKQLDIMRGKVEEVKPEEMVQGLSLDSKAGLSAFKSDQNSIANTSTIGSEDYNMAVALSLDATTMENMLPLIEQYTPQLAEAFKNTWLEEMANGLDIPDEAWEEMETAINEKLAELNIDPIKLDVKTGNIGALGKEAKASGEEFTKAAQAVSSMGTAMQSIEDPTAKVAGMIAQAIASIAMTFAASLKGTFTPWDWIAAAAAGTATMIATIASIKSATKGYADGGLIKGGSFAGDATPIMANAGEVVLNASMQRNLAGQLESNASGGGGGSSTISGEQIVTVVNAYGRRTGRGEILR